MGQDLNFACKDCKVTYYIGYGSARMKESHEYKACVNAHEGHNVETFSTDYLEMRGNDLWYESPINDGNDYLFIQNYKSYVDLEPPINYAIP